MLSLRVARRLGGDTGSCFVVWSVVGGIGGGMRHLLVCCFVFDDEAVHIEN